MPLRPARLTFAPRSIKSWTLTTSGPFAPRYFIRLSKTGDPNAAISYNLGNGGPTLDQRQVIDAGFLEVVRLGAPLDRQRLVDAESLSGEGLGAHRQRQTRLRPGELAFRSPDV